MLLLAEMCVMKDAHFLFLRVRFTLLVFLTYMLNRGIDKVPRLWYTVMRRKKKQEN